MERTPESPEYTIAVLTMNPAMNPDVARASLTAFPDHKAMVIVGYASGSTPDWLNPIIQESTAAGTPVFIVSSNYGSDHGIANPSYGVHAAATQAGAIFIEDMNSRNIFPILDSIQEEIDSGKTGLQLAQPVRAKHSI